jgi:CSLREA domain-containing protein
MRITLGLRTFSALIAASFVLAACGGGGHSVPSGLVPGGNAGGSSGGGASAAHGNGNVAFTIRIPRAFASSRLRAPATISAGTNSLAVTVNGASQPQTFNIAAPACTMSSPNVCTFNVGAPYGLDSFLIETFSGSNGTGTALNAAATSLNVTQAGPNQASATAGTILTVTSNADAGGSCGITGPASGCTLREAVNEAAADFENNGGGSYTDAIMFAPGVSNITLSSGTITLGSNIALIGPGASAPPNPAAAGAPVAAGNLTINGSGNQIFNNRSNGSYTFIVSGLTLTNGTSSDLAGGAIESFGTLAIYNTIFNGNSAPGVNSEGGAVYDEGTNTPVVASTFINNSSEYGGAYGVEAPGTTFTNCLFTGNNAFSADDDYGEGGAIYIDQASTVSASTFTNNVAGSMSTEGVDGYVEGDGGAVSIDDPSALVMVVNSTFGTSSSNGNFAGGSSANDDGYGGGIYVYDDNSPGLISSGNTFTANASKGGAGASGGAIEVDVGQFCTGVQNDCATAASPDRFTNNVADSTAGNTSSFGGAVYSQDYGTGATWVGTAFSGNQALSAGSSSQSYGGAVYAVVCSLTGNNLSFANNVASAGGLKAEGGGFYATSGECSPPSVVLSNAQFSGNSATGALTSAGGGLYVDSINIGFSSTTFTSNSAVAVAQPSSPPQAFGGGFEYYDGTQTLKSNSRKSGAQATARGNALAAAQAAHARGAARRAARRARKAAWLASRHASSRLQVAGLRRTITAVRRPAVVASGDNTLVNVTFSGNTVNGGNAGSAYGGGADLSGDVTLTGASFTNNSATASGGGTGYGGGISFSGATYCDVINFTGTITNNTALTEGGGLWTACTPNITNSTITLNNPDNIYNTPL